MVVSGRAAVLMNDGTEVVMEPATCSTSHTTAGWSEMSRTSATVAEMARHSGADA